MRNTDDKTRNQFLDHAWKIAFDSMTYDVSSNNNHSTDILIDAKRYVREIDKKDWWPIASKLYNDGEKYNEHALAEKALTIFVNKKMETSGLIASVGGDY